MSDEPLQVCPECGKHIRRVLYPAGIVFKGSGFYKTDHGNGSLPEGKKSDKVDGASSETPATGNTSGESKESKAGESKSSESKAPASSTSSTSRESKVPAGTA